MMRINGTTKSLVANHLAESVAGAMTIRAFEEEEETLTLLTSTLLLSFTVLLQMSG
jgi:hypothetical protein